MVKIRRSHDRLFFNMGIPNTWETRSLYWLRRGPGVVCLAVTVINIIYVINSAKILLKTIAALVSIEPPENMSYTYNTPCNHENS